MSVRMWQEAAIHLAWAVAVWVVIITFHLLFGAAGLVGVVTFLVAMFVIWAGRA